MRDYGVEALAPEDWHDAVDCGVELDGADERYCFPRGEVGRYGVDEVLRINTNRHEDIQCCYLRDRHRNQATMRVMYKKVAAQGSGGKVIDAACAIGHIAHDQG